MRQWIQQQLTIDPPFTCDDLTNPLFYVHANLLPRINTPENLRRTTFRLVIAVMLGAVIAFIGLAVAAWLTFDLGWLFEGLLWVAQGVIVLSVIFDFFYIYYGISSMRQLTHPAMTDLLRLSPVPAETVIAAQLQVARLHAWRLFVVNITLHCMIALLMLAVGGVVLLELAVQSNNDAIGLWQEILFTIIWFGGVVLGIIYLFIYEPYWRYQTMTAIGIRQGAQHATLYHLIDTTIFSIVGFWFIQFIFVAGLATVSAFVFGIGTFVISFVYIESPTLWADLLLLIMVGSIYTGWTITALSILRAAQIEGYISATLGNVTKQRTYYRLSE